MSEPSWQVRVRSSGRDMADVYVRQSRFRVGLPLAFDQEYDGVTAVETVLGAIGADLVNGFASAARRLRLQLDQLEALVEGRLHNPLTYLGVVGEQGHPGLETVRARLYVGTLAPEAEVSRAWQEMLARSPLVATFRDAVRLELSYKISL